MRGELRYKRLGKLEKNINSLIHTLTDCAKCDNVTIYALKLSLIITHGL